MTYVKHKIQVIIPAATYVPEELRGLGKLPAIIYPINDEIVFDYIYRQYVGKVDLLKVICYEGAEDVQDRLNSNAYEKVRFRLITLPVLKDLAYTIYSALEKNDNCPTIINFSDTIVLDVSTEMQEDSFYYHEAEPTERWTFFEQREGIIKEVYDKVSDGAKDTHKLFVGVFQIMNPLDFRDCLECAFLSYHPDISNFYYALMLYSERHPMRPIYTERWFDIGHLDRYFNSMLEVRARNFNHITIDKSRGILEKTSEEKEKFIGEILWYLKLPSDLEYVHPRVFSYSTEYWRPRVAMEYYSYHTLHELFLYGGLSAHQWRDIFRRVKFVLDDFKRYQVYDKKKVICSQKEMYWEKTCARLENAMDGVLSDFRIQPFVVNGIRYKRLDLIIKYLEKAVTEMLYSESPFCIVHGDLCFSNIMVDSSFSFVKLIDPRGRFGEYDIYGDQRYELAKLLHSIEGKYDFILKDMFRLNLRMGQRGAEIQYKINGQTKDFDLLKIFQSVFAEDLSGKMKEIRLIEALLFLSMIPLHSENQKHQFVMFATGIELMDQVLDIREKDSECATHSRGKE